MIIATYYDGATETYDSLEALEAALELYEGETWDSPDEHPSALRPIRPVSVEITVEITDDQIPECASCGDATGLTAEEQRWAAEGTLLDDDGDYHCATCWPAIHGESEVRT